MPTSLRRLQYVKNLAKGLPLTKNRYLFCLRNVLSTHWELLGMHWKGLYFRQSFYLLPFVAPPIFSTNFRRPYCEPYFRRPYSLLPFFPQLNHRPGQIERYLCQLFTLLTKLNVPKRVCSAQFQNRRSDNCRRCQFTALVNKNARSMAFQLLWIIHKNAPLYNRFST